MLRVLEAADRGVRDALVSLPALPVGEVGDGGVRIAGEGGQAGCAGVGEGVLEPGVVPRLEVEAHRRLRSGRPPWHGLRRLRRRPRPGLARRLHPHQRPVRPLHHRRHRVHRRHPGRGTGPVHPAGRPPAPQPEAEAAHPLAGSASERGGGGFGPGCRTFRKRPSAPVVSARAQAVSEPPVSDSTVCTPPRPAAGRSAFLTMKFLTW